VALLEAKRRRFNVGLDDRTLEIGLSLFTAEG
jgi:hypothetical protein